ncbi:response regulator [Bifidobacterium samirii]|uniref:DNA-binding response regulator n=1 Tax=Bifidobacterium samirii TaxID=2306974 RepID=A0A430FGV8_9BIFI|nr:DNA-binding response regulator [Bifidobacterium samirii]
MNEHNRIRVVIADDQELVRAGFAMVIGSQPDMEVVGQAGDGAQAVALAETLRPDVVLMDVRMPGMDGLEATGRISALAPAAGGVAGAADARFGAIGAPGAVVGAQTGMINGMTAAAAGPTGASSANTTTPVRTTRVIILTTFDLDEYVMAAINAGASGFLLKDTEPETLLSSIRTVFNGNAIIAPSATKRLIEKMMQDGYTHGGAVAGTTAAGPGAGMPSAPMAGGYGHATPVQPAPGTTLPGQASAATDAQPAFYTDPELELLTDREREVLIEIAHGLSNQEIADKLYISLPTVKTHVAHILAKINARDRVQAVVFAYDNRLV